MRYPESSLIRCAPAAARVAKPVNCGHRVPQGSKAFPAPLRRRKSRPCSPASVFCSPRSCCRYRSWCSGSARRPCCARPTRNLPAPLRGAWRQSRNLPSRTTPRRSPRKSQCPCWRYCASNRSRRSRPPRTVFRRPRRQPSHRRSPRRRISPRKSPRWSRRTKPRRRPRSLKSRSRKLQCKARRRPPTPRPPPPLRKPGSRRRSRSCRRPMKPWRPHPNQRSYRPRPTPISSQPGSPPWAVRPLRSRRSRRRRPPRQARPERRQEAPAGAARQGATQDRVARATGRGSTTSRRSVRAADDHHPQPLNFGITPDRSRPAGRRAGPIRPTSRHTALTRARRAGTAPASAPARRRRSRSWSRSALSGRRPLP